MFSSGYHLAAGSPCLDAGAAPAIYSGVPPVDLDGGLRLRDWNGDGLSYADMGTYEATNPAVRPSLERFVDERLGRLRGGASNQGDDYGIGW